MDYSKIPQELKGSTKKYFFHAMDNICSSLDLLGADTKQTITGVSYPIEEYFGSREFEYKTYTFNLPNPLKT